MIEGHLLSFARMYGALLLLPLSSLGLGETKRIMIAFLLSWVIGVREFNVELLIIEFILGMLIALPSMLLLDFLIQGAEIFDVSRGASMDVVYSPNTQHHEHTLQQLVRVAGIAIYFSSGAVLSLFKGLVDAPSISFMSNDQISRVIIYVIQEVGVGVICFVLPFALACGLIEFVIGWGAKSLPSLSLANESFLLRMIAGGFFLQFAASAESIETVGRLFDMSSKMGISVLGALSEGG